MADEPLSLGDNQLPDILGMVLNSRCSAEGAVSNLNPNPSEQCTPEGVPSAQATLSQMSASSALSNDLGAHQPLSPSIFLNSDIANPPTSQPKLPRLKRRSLKRSHESQGATYLNPSTSKKKNALALPSIKLSVKKSADSEDKPIIVRPIPKRQQNTTVPAYNSTNQSRATTNDMNQESDNFQEDDKEIMDITERAVWMSSINSFKPISPTKNNDQGSSSGKGFEIPFFKF